MNASLCCAMTQLYVGNLSAEGDERAIKVLFGKYGIVREVLMKNGYAFVEYDSAYSAEEAIRALNGECACMFAAAKLLSMYNSSCQSTRRSTSVSSAVTFARSTVFVQQLGEAFTCIFEGRQLCFCLR